MKHRNLIIFGLLILIIIPLVVVFFLFPQPKRPGNGNIPNPSGSPQNGTLPGQEKDVLIVFPVEDTTQVFLPIQRVKITFTKSVEADDLVISSSPSVTIKVGLDPIDPNSIIIAADPVWQEGITTLTIKKSGKTGKALFEKDVIYRINTAYPKNAPEVE